MSVKRRKKKNVLTVLSKNIKVNRVRVRECLYFLDSSGSNDSLKHRIYVVFPFFSPQPVFCYKGSKSSGIRPEPRLESLNPDALQSRERAIHLLIGDSKQAFCVEERERARGRGKKEGEKNAVE